MEYEGQERFIIIVRFVIYILYYSVFIGGSGHWGISISIIWSNKYSVQYIGTVVLL